MNRLRTVPETDLLIVSGYIEPGLARDFQDEWIEQLRDEQRRELFVPRKFFDDDHGVFGLFERSELPATHRVLQLLGFSPADITAGLGINFQSPLGVQNFHQDNPSSDGVVYVVHGADEGAFDYAPGARTQQEAEASFMTVEMRAGDVLLQTQQSLYHRGRNAGLTPRVTAAIARIETDYFYDPSR